MPPLGASSASEEVRRQQGVPPRRVRREASQAASGEAKPGRRLASADNAGRGTGGVNEMATRKKHVCVSKKTHKRVSCKRQRAGRKAAHKR